MALPPTMKATVIDQGTAIIKTVPLPHLEDGYILIRTRAVAGNPTDWKHAKFSLGPQGSILGVDAAGEIVALGNNVDLSKFHIGDYVYGFVKGGSHRTPDNGAFAQYTALDSKLTFTLKNGLSNQDFIPEGPVDSLEAGASIPCSWLTAGATVFYHMGLRMEQEPTQVQKNGTILIWGGATALGQAILQLLQHFNGFERVIVVASKKHGKKLKNYGATEVFDYHDSDIVQQIKSGYHDITWLIDCVSSPETFNQLYRCAPTDTKSIIFNYSAMDGNSIKPELRHGNVTFDRTMIYAAFGYEVQLGQMVFPVNQEYRKVIINYVEFINNKLATGLLQHIPIKVYKNGFNATIQIMEDLKNGKSSGEKLVTILDY